MADSHLYDIVVSSASMTIRWCRARAAPSSCTWRATDYSHTAGCVALADARLRAALAQLQPGDKVLITD